MASTAAQDEFNALMADKGGPKMHPEDAAAVTNGRRSSSPRSGKSSRSGSIQNEKRSSPGGSPNSRAKYTLPSINPNANTGPKGVIADARAFEQALKQSKRFSFFTRSRSQPPGTDSSDMKFGEAEKRRGSDEERARDLEEDDDEGFLSRWRQSRLRELKDRAVGDRSWNKQASSTQTIPEVDARSSSRNRSKRYYGTLSTVDASGFLDAIEHAPADTGVLVLVFDEGSDASDAVEECVRALAAKHATTRFVALSWEEAEMERAGVPAMLMYKDGELEKQLTPLLQEIEGGVEGLSVERLERALQRNNML